MARDNYGFQKRQRELAKKKKKEEKRLRKLAKANPEAVEGSETRPEGPAASEGPVEPGTPPAGEVDGAPPIEPTP